MRRSFLLIAGLGVFLSVTGTPAEAKRRAVFVPTGASQCFERDSDGTCVRSSADERGGGIAFWLILAAISLAFGGGAFKLMRRGLGVAVVSASATAGSLARSAVESSSKETSDWAAKAAKNFGAAGEPDRVASTPVTTSSAPVTTRIPHGGYRAPVVRSRSAGFGQTAGLGTEPTPPQIERAVPARAVPVTTLRKAQASRTQGAAQPRASFGRR